MNIEDTLPTGEICASWNGDVLVALKHGIPSAAATPKRTRKSRINPPSSIQ